MNELTIVAAQINLFVGDIKGNAERIIEETQKISESHKPDIIVFPELTLTGYPPEDLLLRPGFYRRCDEALKHIQSQIGDTAIIIGYPQSIERKQYNKAAFIYQGKILADYSKQYLPNYEVFDEVRYFTPGKSSCVVDFKGYKLGIVICEDLWFPDPSKQAIDAGAECIISLNASPYDRHKVRARELMLAKRATEGHVPIIYTNLVGGQDELVFDGGSMVVDHQGIRCQQAAYYKEDYMVVTLKKDERVHVVAQPLPPRLSEEDNIYQTLVLGVRDYIEKNQFPGAIIGLSGGIDSALTLAIAVDAIGANRVHAVMMPTRYTSSISLKDAEQEAKTLGIEYSVIPIEPIFKAFLTALAPEFKNLPADTTEENLQARIRGMTLMAISNKKGFIVLTTGNKSEMSVGYATLYGDMAGGFSVLKDVPKTLVYRLARYRNQMTTHDIIPERVIERPPSAELAEDQKDEDSLPPYPVLDEILDRYVDQDQDPTAIYAAGLDKETVNRVIKMVNRNEYKRRQAPVGIRITQRAFGKDRRYPITSGYTKNI